MEHTPLGVALNSALLGTPVLLMALACSSGLASASRPASGGSGGMSAVANANATTGSASTGARSSTGGTSTSTGGTSTNVSTGGAPTVPGEAELRAFLGKFTPGTAHEAKPHGVPAGYDWYSASGQPTLSPPNGETVANWWGQIYVDESGFIAPNVRVAVTGGAFLALYKDSDTWVTVQPPGGMGGGTWAEDFHSNCAVYDAKQESNTVSSWATKPGCNAHYWPDIGQSDIDETKVRAVVVLAFTELVLDDAQGPDNRATAKYINGVGADWRIPGGGCPTPPGSSVGVCNGIGGGKFIRVGNEWRTMVFQSMSASELLTFPLPPVEKFRQPDGQYFR